MVGGERKGKPQFWWTDLRTGIPPQIDIIGLQRKEMSCILRNGFMLRWLDDHFSMIQKKAFHVSGRLLTGSPLMYHDKFVGGLEFCAIHIRSAVSPT